MARRRRKKKSLIRKFQLLIVLIIFAAISLFGYFFATSNKNTNPEKFADAIERFAEFINDTEQFIADLRSGQGIKRGVTTTNLNLNQIEQGYPKINVTHNQTLIYSGFHLSYNEEHEQANWVAYILTKDEVKRDRVDRTDNFRSDENVTTVSASPEDYRGSGYDRGHLAPAADMHWSRQSMTESFLMSNMSPQEPGFNRGIWRELEEKVRDWAVDNEKIYVVTGPVLKNVRKRIGANRVSVPPYYYKVILDISPPEYKGIAFLLENKESRQDISKYAITIDELEKFTGYDFFHYVDVADIEVIEANTDLSLWGLR